jgi:hypothetical protein
MSELYRQLNGPVDWLRRMLYPRLAEMKALAKELHSKASGAGGSFKGLQHLLSQSSCMHRTGSDSYILIEMSCLIPAGASLKARKIYNRLVPDVFPPSAPQPMEQISVATMRKISKLQEYVQNAPGQIAKVGSILHESTWHSVTDASDA